MKMKLNSWDLNRMMKTIGKCVDPKDTNKGNVEVTCGPTEVRMRATNGTFFAELSTPYMGGGDESFCVDAGMFGKVIAMCSGDVEIETSAKICSVKGAGRTRLPIVDAKIPAAECVTGQSVNVRGYDLYKAWKSVEYAVSADMARIVLTGVLTVTENGRITLVALDGFQMSMAEAECDGENIKAVIPGAFMRMLTDSIVEDDSVRLTVGGGRIQAETDGMLLSCSLLADDYPDWKRLVPEHFKTESLVNVDQLKNALKSGSVVNSGNNLVKIRVEKDRIVVNSNSETADYEAEVGCETNGEELKIAFNQKYLMNTISAVSTENAVMEFNSPTQPCIVRGTEENGLHLVLPVRVMG